MYLLSLLVSQKVTRACKLWLNSRSPHRFCSVFLSFPRQPGFCDNMRLSSTLATWVLPMIVASSASCSGPNSSCAANDMEANVLLQMSEVNEMGTDALSDDVIPPREEA